MRRLQKEREPRESVDFKMLSYHRSSGDFMGYVMDISPRGLRLLSEYPLQLEVIELQLELPETMEGAGRINLYAQRRWSRHLTGGRWIAGFRIKEDYSESGLVDRLIHSTEFHSGSLQTSFTGCLP